MRECHAQIEAGRVSGPPGKMFGYFTFTHPETLRKLVVIASDLECWASEGIPGEPWEHVSVSCKVSVPIWREMCWVKDLFWGDEEWVVQYHPAKADYVNTHDHVLHLWKPVNMQLPIPPKECV